MAKILHVDDEEWLLKDVQRELQELGHQVQYVQTVQGARDLLAREKFDLVIWDGNIELKWDGAALAWGLYHAGEKSVILSDDSSAPSDPGKVPRIRISKRRQTRVRDLQQAIDSIMERSRDEANDVATDTAH